MTGFVSQQMLCVAKAVDDPGSRILLLTSQRPLFTVSLLESGAPGYAGATVCCVDTLAQVCAELDRAEWDLVLADDQGPDWDATTLVDLVVASEATVVLFVPDEPRASAALLAGAHDFVLSSQLDQLHLRVGAALARTWEQRAAEELAREHEQLKVVAVGVSHALSNELASVAGYAGLVVKPADSIPVTQSSSVELSAAAKRAIVLVRRLASFVQADTESTEVLAPGLLLEQALKVVRHALPSGFEVQRTFAVDLPAIRVDATAVLRVLTGLSLDLARACPLAGHFRLSAAEGALPGAPESLKVAWARGALAFRPPASATARQRRRVERAFRRAFAEIDPVLAAQGGSAVLASPADAGFELALYFRSMEVAEVTSARPSLPSSSHVRRVLFVDDEPALVRLTNRSLKRLGHFVTAYDDAHVALADFHARSLEFDVVITDLSMPDVSGLDFAEAVREARPEIPIILTCGNISPADRKRAQLLGLEIVKKPNSPEILQQAIARLTARKSLAV